jgi:hypothetical protein
MSSSGQLQPNDTEYDKFRDEGVAATLKTFCASSEANAKLTYPPYDVSTTTLLSAQNTTTLLETGGYLSAFLTQFQMASDHLTRKTPPPSHIVTQTVFSWLLGSERVRYALACVYDSNFEALSRENAYVADDEDNIQTFFTFLSMSYRVLLRNGATKSANATAFQKGINDPEEWKVLFGNLNTMDLLSPKRMQPQDPVHVFGGCIGVLVSHLKAIGLYSTAASLLDSETAQLISTDLQAIATNKSYRRCIDIIKLNSEFAWNTIGDRVAVLFMEVRPFLGVWSPNNLSRKEFTAARVTNSSFIEATYKLVPTKQHYTPDTYFLYELVSIQTKQ